MAKLLPCPFCGGSSFNFREEDENHLNSTWTWHELRCDECPALIRYPSKDGTIAAWNRRASLQHGGE